MAARLPPVALVFNPAAGRGDGALGTHLRALLAPWFDLRVHETCPGKDADRCAQEAIEQGARMVIAAGGDGTVGAVADVLRHTRIPLGIIPCGTANSVATALQLPANVQDACAAITHGYARCLDTAVCNGRSMVLMASVGVHAETIADTPRELKNRWGRMAYLVEAVQKMRGMTPFRATIETDTRIISCDAVAVTVANVAPPTTVFAQGPANLVGDDGYLDITIVCANGVLEAVATGAHLLASAAVKEPAARENVGYLQARRARITAEPAQRLMIDGEEGGEGALDVECHPRSLWVMVPRGPAPAPLEKLEGLPNLVVTTK